MAAKQVDSLRNLKNSVISLKAENFRVMEANTMTTETYNEEIGFLAARKGDASAVIQGIVRIT